MAVNREYFDYKHLPLELREISEPFHKVMRIMDKHLLGGAEKEAGMRKLLEAKDCFVRATRETTPEAYSYNIKPPTVPIK